MQRKLVSIQAIANLEPTPGANFIEKATCDLPTVPTLEVDPDFDYGLEELLAIAEGTYENTKNPREGIVIRPTTEAHSEVLQGRLSIKVINNQYLLKGGED